MSDQHTRPVVVGVDGGPGSAGALRYAVAEAVRRDAPLHIVHVIAIAPLATPVPGAVSELHLAAESILRHARQKTLHLAPELEVHLEVGHGSRSAALVAAAEGAQLLVVGRETRHGVERVLTGATTAGAASRAACDVVVVPSFWTDDHRRGRVVAGIKTQSQAHELLGEAFAEASARGATLTLVTAWQLPDPYLDRIELRTHADDWKAEGRQVIEGLLSEWRTVYPDVPVEIRVEHGRAASVLVEASRDSDVLFLCRRRYAVHPHGHLGGVAYAVLQSSEAPVHVVSSKGALEAAMAVELQLEDAGQPLK